MSNIFSSNAANDILMKTKDAIFEEIKKMVDEKKRIIEHKKFALMEETGDLDYKKD